MRKVAIVGVEGSGKTVMLAGLGDLYTRPDDKGYFLAPKDFNTSSYVAELMGRLRSGIWPAATADDAFQGLEWTLRRRSDAGGRPTDICELSCLDFPGEVYRKAFVDTAGQQSEDVQSRIESLWNYIERADSLIVLVNLGDVILHGLTNRRVHESIWVTSGILNEALKERPGRVVPKAAIVLSQADKYEATIKECGGAREALEKYLPEVYYSYDWLDVFAAYTIDKKRLDDDGMEVPDPSFTAEGLRPIMDWLLQWDAPKTKNPTPLAAPGALSGINKHFTFQGRKNRAQYWRTIGSLAILHLIGMGIIIAAVLSLEQRASEDISILELVGILGGIFILLCAYLSFVTNIVQRLHDFNRSGKWGLLCLIPYIGWVLPILLGIIPGTNSDNEYGRKP